jgi:S1-C subfamily serine protease
VVLVAVWAGQRSAEAHDLASTRAVVFIRVFGDVEADADTQSSPVPRPAVSRKNVQVSTGSGFVFSPLGQVLTCHHVVADSDRTAVVDGRRVRVRTTVRRIEVQFVGGGDGSMPIDRLEATVVASNPDLDLAVLSIAATDLPTLDLGDSDALVPGEPLDAVGFPFGEEVEIARQVRESAPAPEPTVSRGNFSAFRGDGDGARRFLQTTAAVNPGNSGGPILDRDGYVVGVIARRLTGTSAQVVSIGFAVPVNVVKEFLESRGLDGQLPRRLVLGGLQSFEGKGLRARIPVGFSDVSPLRTRIDSGATTATPLHVDRVVTPWDLARIEDALTADRVLEGFTATAAIEGVSRQAGGKAVVARVNGTMADGSAARMEFAIVEFGREKVVLRYIGPAALMAYNASVFRASLTSLEVEALRREPPQPIQPASWAVSPLARQGTTLADRTLPTGWVHEPVGAMPCGNLPAAAEQIGASPVADFTRVLRLSVIDAAGLAAKDAASACRTSGSSLDPTRYERDVEWLGVRFKAVGAFVPATTGRLIQVEAVAPADLASGVRDWVTAWMTQNGASQPGQSRKEEER